MNDIVRRARILAACVSIALLATVLPVAASAQDLEDWQRDELRGLLDAIDSAVEGEIVPEADPFELRPDFLKGTDGNVYVPFTLMIDPANAPEGYPPGRPRPTVFNEVWELESNNLLLRAENRYRSLPS